MGEAQKKYKKSDKYRAYNKEYMKKYHKRTKHYIENKQKYLDKSFKQRLKGFWMDIEDYNLLHIKQEGRCACCGKHQTEFETRLAVDHCHTTGIIRGLLCFGCNTGIGKLGDNLEGLQRAVKYLEKTYEN